MNSVLSQADIRFLLQHTNQETFLGKFRRTGTNSAKRQKLSVRDQEVPLDLSVKGGNDKVGGGLLAGTRPTRKRRRVEVGMERLEYRIDLSVKGGNGKVGGAVADAQPTKKRRSIIAFGRNEIDAANNKNRRYNSDPDQQRSNHAPMQQVPTLSQQVSINWDILIDDHFRRSLGKKKFEELFPSSSKK